jgi:hypothetical protein
MISSIHESYSTTSTIMVSYLITKEQENKRTKRVTL